MKLTVKLLIAVSSCVVTAGIISPMMAQRNQLIKQAVAQIPSTQNLPSTKTPATSPLSPPPQIPNLNNPQLYNENPPPRLIGNKELSTANFISREQAIGKLPPNARLISADLISWGQHEAETLHGARFHEASKERMVWAVKVAYPDGIKTQGGFYGNATATIVHDAQTGRFIDLTITCAPSDYKPEVMPWNIGGKVPISNKF